MVLVNEMKVEVVGGVLRKVFLQITPLVFALATTFFFFFFLQCPEVQQLERPKALIKAGTDNVVV